MTSEEENSETDWLGRKAWSEMEESTDNDTDEDDVLPLRVERAIAKMCTENRDNDMFADSD